MPVTKETIEQFAQRIKTKYPDYKSIPDTELVNRIVDKHPEYRDKVDFGGAAPAQSAKSAAPVSAATPTHFPGTPNFSDLSSYIPDPSKELYEQARQGAATRMQQVAQAVDPAIMSILTREEHQRRANVLESQLQEKGDLANTNPRLRQTLERVLPKPLPVEISSTAVDAMKQQASTDPTVFGEILREHAKLNPKDAGQIKADMYLLNSPQAPGKEAKRLENAENMKAGKADYNLWHPAGVEIPEGFLPSIVTAHRERNQEINDYEYFQTHGDADIIKKLDADKKAYDPDEPKHVPSGVSGALGSGLGGNAEIIAKGGAAAALSTMLGAPEVAPYFGAAMATPEMTARAFSGSLKNTYYQLLDQGKSPDEALKTAKNQATIDAAKAGAQGVLMTVAGAKLGLRGSGGYKFTPQFKNIITGIAKETGKFGKEALATGLPNAAIAGGLEAASNMAAKSQGINRTIDQNVFEAAGGQLALELALGATLKLGGKALKVVLNNVSKQPQGAVQSTLKDMESHGTITPEQGQAISDNVDAHRAVDEQIPPHVGDENTRIKINDLIQHKTKLEGDLETLNKAYHPAIKQKIADIDEEIQKLSGLSVKEKPEGAAPPPAKTEGDKALTDIPEEIKTPNIQSDETDKSSAPVSESGTGYAVIRNVKPKENAIQEPSPSGVLQHPQEGAGESGGERGGMESGQQGEESSQSRPEEGQTEGKEENVGGKEPPPFNMWDLPFEPSSEDLTGITHEETERTRQDLGLGGEPYKSNRKYDIELNEQADKAIKSGYDVNGLISKLETGHSPDDLENTILKKYKAYLSNKVRVNPSDENLAEIRRFSKATDVAGTLQGRAFRARKGLDLNDNSLEGYFNRDMEAAGTEVLTPEHKEQVVKEYDDISSTQARLDKKVSDLEAENARLKAEKEFKKSKGGGIKKEKTDYVKERKDIVDSIKEKLRKARGETTITVVPYAKELIAIAPDVAKLVKSYVAEVGGTLEEVVSAIREQLKDALPQITEKDVHNIIAGEYSGKKEFTELQQNLRDLRTQAQLVNKLEALQRGEQPVTQKKRTAKNRAIEELQKKIKDFKDEQGKDAKNPLASLKARLKKQISELEGKLKDGDYSKPVKPLPIQLDKEAIELQDRLIELKTEREKRLAQLEYDKKSGVYKAWRNTIEAFNIPRTVMASADLSAPLRQGAVATVAHPIVAGGAAVEMLKSAVSQKNFDRWLFNLKESPAYQIMKESGLYIADPDNLHLAAREEAFMSHMAEKVPLVGRIIKGSERAYTAYLNKMRADIFINAADAFAHEGKTIENSPELYKGLAKFVNAATGRGELPGILKTAAPALSVGFFSPRLIASRLQLINPVYYVKMPKEIRIMALKDMAKFIAVGTSVLALAKLAGADVEHDPRSPDFGKIKVGNTRWDIWGGFQQYIRVISETLTRESKSSTSGQIHPLTETTVTDEMGNTHTKKPFQTLGDVWQSFGRSKLAPVPGTILDWAYGKDVVGKKFDPATKAISLFTPMVANDIHDAWKDQGVKALFTVGLPSALGVGVTTYGGDKKKTSLDVK